VIRLICKSEYVLKLSLLSLKKQEAARPNVPKISYLFSNLNDKYLMDVGVLY